MRTSNIDFNNVLKRKLAMNSIDGDSDAFNMYRVAKRSLQENMTTFNRDVEKFFNQCKNTRNANKYYTNCLSILENMDDNHIIKNRMVSIFSNDIIPYIKNLNTLKESLDRFTLNTDDKYLILNSIKENKICDRIISNDIMLKKRFNIEKIIDDSRHLPLENIVFECCSLLDTYSDIPSYGKLNIALEELSYYLQKQDVEYDKSRFVELVVEYFLYVNNNLNESVKTKYKNVLNENIFISNKDLSNVKYFVEDNFAAGNDIQSIIYNFNNDECRNLGTFKSNLQEIFEKSPESVISKVTFILETLRHLLIIGTFNHEQIQDIVNYIPTRSIEKQLGANQITKLKNLYDIELQIVDKQIRILSADKYTQLQNYYNSIADCISNMDEYLYRTSDIKCRSIDNQLKSRYTRDEIVPITLQEFKIFKFDNLIKATIKIDKFLRNKSNKITNAIRNKADKVFKATKDFFKEEYSINDILELGIITESDTTDICIAIYKIKEDEVKNVNSLMEALCTDIQNHILYNNKDLDVYYTNIDNLFEIHLECNIPLILSEEEIDIKNNSISSRDIIYMEQILTVSECVNKLSKINIDNIIKSFSDILIENNDIETSSEIIKLLPYADILSKNKLNMIISEYADIYPYNYTNNTILNNLLESYSTLTHIPLELQTESIVSIDNILFEKKKYDEDEDDDDDYDDEDEDDDDDEDDKKSKKKKKSKKEEDDDYEEKLKRKSSRSIENKINNLKLYSMDIKKKAKDLSAKEQELSRNADATVNSLYRSMKQAVVSDRREAIIKGSIIPSFSKLVKTAIALAGVAIVFNPIYSVIAVVVGLAASKILTEKERSLLLDEIEIELKVVEKEIQIAENNNNMKKYRSLISFKKKLQREHSRIRYNLKIGRDLPDNPTNDYD